MASTSPPQCPTRTLGRRIGILLAVAVVIALVHGPVLRGLAWPLVADERPTETDFLCLRGGELAVDGEDALQHAAAWCRQSPSHRILLPGASPRRVVEIGVLPGFPEMVRGGLAKLAVPADVVVAMPGHPKDEWDQAHVLETWLQDHPGDTILLFASRLNSGRLRYILDTALGRDLAGRIRILAPANPAFNETNWWRTRDGVKDFMFGWLRLACTWGEGEGRTTPLCWSTNEYQAILKKAFGEAPP